MVKLHISRLPCSSLLPCGARGYSRPTGQPPPENFRSPPLIWRVRFIQQIYTIYEKVYYVIWTIFQVGLKYRVCVIWEIWVSSDIKIVLMCVKNDYLSSKFKVAGSWWLSVSCLEAPIFTMEIYSTTVKSAINEMRKYIEKRISTELCLKDPA